MARLTTSQHFYDELVTRTNDPAAALRRLEADQETDGWLLGTFSLHFLRPHTVWADNGEKITSEAVKKELADLSRHYVADPILQYQTKLTAQLYASVVNTDSIRWYMQHLRPFRESIALNIRGKVALRRLEVFGKPILNDDYSYDFPFDLLDGLNVFRGCNKVKITSDSYGQIVRSAYETVSDSNGKILLLLNDGLIVKPRRTERLLKQVYTAAKSIDRLAYISVT